MKSFVENSGSVKFTFSRLQRQLSSGLKGSVNRECVAMDDNFSCDCMSCVYTIILYMITLRFFHVASISKTQTRSSQYGTAVFSLSSSANSEDTMVISHPGRAPLAKNVGRQRTTTETALCPHTQQIPRQTAGVSSLHWLPPSIRRTSDRRGKLLCHSHAETGPPRIAAGASSVSPA